MRQLVEIDYGPVKILGFGKNMNTFAEEVILIDGDNNIFVMSLSKAADLLVPVEPEKPPETATVATQEVDPVQVQREQLFKAGWLVTKRPLSEPATEDWLNPANGRLYSFGGALKVFASRDEQRQPPADAVPSDAPPMASDPAADQKNPFLPQHAESSQ